MQLLTAPPLAVRQLELHVDASNAAAESLYSRIGFSETGRCAAYYRKAGGGDAKVLAMP